MKVLLAQLPAQGLRMLVEADPARGVPGLHPQFWSPQAPGIYWPIPNKEQLGRITFDGDPPYAAWYEADFGLPYQPRSRA